MALVVACCFLTFCFVFLLLLVVVVGEIGNGFICAIVIDINDGGGEYNPIVFGLLLFYC